jgi:prepilin-type N-terminal cleavage/methylation domain-containing protein
VRYKSRGFTLIELLVVIAIIAILAAILFPVFTSAKQRVQMTKCLNNLKHLAMAARMYADDHQGIMPYDWPDKPNWCGCEAASAWVYPQKGQLWPYTRNMSIYICPLDIGKPALNISSIPSGKSQKDYPLSYSMNHSAGSKNIDTFTRPAKRMLFIQENRNSDKYFNLNDGTFVTGEQDIPGYVHYDGTALAYMDGHAAWKSRSDLLYECKNVW